VPSRDCIRSTPIDLAETAGIGLWDNISLRAPKAGT